MFIFKVIFLCFSIFLEFLTFSIENKKIKEILKSKYFKASAGFGGFLSAFFISKKFNFFRSEKNENFEQLNEESFGLKILNFKEFIKIKENNDDNSTYNLLLNAIKNDQLLVNKKIKIDEKKF